MANAVCKNCVGMGVVRSPWPMEESLTCRACDGTGLANATDADVVPREELIRMLKASEWGGNGGYQKEVCAECLAEERDGHKSGCKLADAIGAPTRPPATR